MESDGVQRLCHQRVSQVYCSAVALGYSGSAYNKNATGPFPTLVRAFAKAVLMASYRLTLQAAVYNAHHSTLPGRKKVFLTHVGGGVFGNERDAINDAICTAIEEVRNYDLDVYIVRFVHNNFSLGNDEVEINERLARMHAADV